MFYLPYTIYPDIIEMNSFYYKKLQGKLEKKVEKLYRAIPYASLKNL